jgi:hypothetical protein
MTTTTPMTSWDLFEDLRAAQDEMMRATRGRGWWPGQHYDASGIAAWAPAVDIYERKDAYLLTAELPGGGRRHTPVTHGKDKDHVGYYRTPDGDQPDAALHTAAAPATGPLRPHAAGRRLVAPVGRPGRGAARADPGPG